VTARRRTPQRHRDTENDGERRGRLGAGRAQMRTAGWSGPGACARATTATVSSVRRAVLRASVSRLPAGKLRGLPACGGWTFASPPPALETPCPCTYPLPVTKAAHPQGGEEWRRSRTS
jgi:hypothetical protein